MSEQGIIRSVFQSLSSSPKEFQTYVYNAVPWQSVAVRFGGLTTSMLWASRHLSFVRRLIACALFFLLLVAAGLFMKLSSSGGTHW